MLDINTVIPYILLTIPYILGFCILFISIRWNNRYFKTEMLLFALDIILFVVSYWVYSVYVLN